MHDIQHSRSQPAWTLIRPTVAKVAQGGVLDRLRVCRQHPTGASDKFHRTSLKCEPFFREPKTPYSADVVLKVIIVSGTRGSEVDVCLWSRSGLCGKVYLRIGSRAAG